MADRGRNRANLHTRAAERRAPADSADGRRIRRERGAAGARPARAEGLGARSSARPAMRRPRPSWNRRARGVRWRRARQGFVDRRGRGGRAVRFLRDHVRRGDRPRHHAAPVLRNRGAEAALPAGPRDRRARRRLRAERVGIRLGCARREGARRAAARRQLHPQRREDVDHQRRVRRPLHRLCESRRRAVHGVSRRAQLSLASARVRRSTSSDSTDRPRRRCYCRKSGFRRATSSARSAAATRSPSTS